MYLFSRLFRIWGGAHFGTSIGDLTISAIGIIIIIWCSKRLCKNKYLEFIGRNTLVYYAFQSKVIKVFEIIVSKLELDTSFVLNGLIIAIFTTLLLAIPSCIFNKVFPFLLGKKDYGILKKYIPFLYCQAKKH